MGLLEQEIEKRPFEQKAHLIQLISRCCNAKIFAIKQSEINEKEEHKYKQYFICTKCGKQIQKNKWIERKIK